MFIKKNNSEKQHNSQNITEKEGEKERESKKEKKREKGRRMEFVFVYACNSSKPGKGQLQGPGKNVVKIESGFNLNVSSVLLSYLPSSGIASCIDTVMYHSGLAQPCNSLEGGHCLGFVSGLEFKALTAPT